MSEGPRAWRFYIDDMISFAEKVLLYTDGFDRRTFTASGLNDDATSRNLELIGEAATHIPDESGQRIRTFRGGASSRHAIASLMATWGSIRTRCGAPCNPTPALSSALRRVGTPWRQANIQETFDPMQISTSLLGGCRSIDLARAGRGFVLASAIAWLPAHADALDDLHAFAAQTKTARGDFMQRVVSRTQKPQQATSGDFVFARPGRFRWSYTKPYEQLLVADGTKLSIYDRDLNQVTVRKLGDALGSTPAAILFGSSDLDQSFALKDVGTRDGIAWLEASPKSRDTAFETIRIGFRNGELAAMELRDALGQTTMLDFSNVQRNPKIDPSTFDFVPPKGADVRQN